MDDGRLTLLFQKDTTFGHDNGYITVDVALTLIIEERNGDVGIPYALLQRHSEDALGAYHSERASQWEYSNDLRDGHGMRPSMEGSCCAFRQWA